MDNQNNDVCMICLESTDKYAITICGCKIHIHTDCFQTWLIYIIRVLYAGRDYIYLKKI